MNAVLTLGVAVGCLAMGLSAWAHLRGQRGALPLLLLGAVALRAGFAFGNECLNPWDEQFHALVAKHLVETPLQPRLYPVPPPGLDYTAWTHNHIWLHKPPLFLWQMALSIKIFGNEVWAVRLPSLLLSVAWVWAVFSVMGRVLGRGPGFWAAWLLALGIYPILLAAGAAGMDHNDVAYLAYAWVGIAFALRAGPGRAGWAWAAAAGFMAAAAVLNKWGFGLFGLAVWGAALVFGRAGWGQWARLGLAAGIAGGIYAAWQGYALWAYPREAAYELAYNWEHVVRAIEGHTGTHGFYALTFPELFNRAVWWALPFLVVFWVWVSKPKANWAWALLAGGVGVYAFFSFIVQTKLTHYVLPALPIVLGLCGLAINALMGWIAALPSRMLARAACMASVAILAWFFLKPMLWVNELRQPRPNCAADWAQTTRQLPPGKWVIHPVAEFQHPAAMFYSGCIVHDSPLDSNVLAYYHRLGYRVAALGTGVGDTTLRINP